MTVDSILEKIKQPNDLSLLDKTEISALAAEIRDRIIQVTSEKGIRSHRVELKVETPEAFILAEDEYHIERGSSLSLVCIIEKATEPPQ